MRCLLQILPTARSLTEAPAARSCSCRCVGCVLTFEFVCWVLQLRLQPDEAIYMKIVVKKPGLEMESIVSELDLSYKQRYGDTYIPDAYERLILDAIRGDQQHFVRRCNTSPMRGRPLRPAVPSGILQSCSIHPCFLDCWYLKLHWTVQLC